MGPVAFPFDFVAYRLTESLIPRAVADAGVVGFEDEALQHQFNMVAVKMHNGEN
jgi:hypothetical protein